MGELGIAVVGCGRAGLVHARNFAGRIRGARLVALVDPVRSAAEEAAKELGVADVSTDYCEALKDPPGGRGGRGDPDGLPPGDRRRGREGWPARVL